MSITLADLIEKLVSIAPLDAKVTTSALRQAGYRDMPHINDIWIYYDKEENTIDIDTDPH